MIKIKRRLLALALALVFFILPFAQGSLAYLTDSASSINVMVVGTVKIEQHEKQRVFDDEGNTIGLEPYSDSGKILQPTVGSESFIYFEKGSNDTLSPKTEESTYRFLSNSAGKSLPLPVDKIVTVKNSGNVSAYVRTVFAFEAPEGFDRIESDLANVSSAPGWTIIFNDENNSDWKWTFLEEKRFKMASASGAISNYVIAIAEYQKPLHAGNETEPSLLQYYFNRHTDDLSEFGESLEIYALTQAVQADGFDNASAAFEEAFGAIEWTGSEFKNVPWDEAVVGNTDN